MMSDGYQEPQITGLGVVLIILAMFSILIFVFDEIVTYPWALWRYTDSFIWSHLFFMPDILTAPHKQIIAGLNELESWKSITITNIYDVEFMVIRTTLLYLLVFIPLVYRIKYKKRHFERFRKRLDFDELIEQETSVIWRYNRYLVNNNPCKESLDVNKGRFAGRETVLNGLKRMQAFNVDRDTNRVTLSNKKVSAAFANQLKHPIKDVNDIYKLPLYYRFCICVFGLRQEKLPPVFTKSEIAKAKSKLIMLSIISHFIPKWSKFKRNVDEQIMHFAYGDYKKTAQIKHNLSFNEDVRFQLCGDYSFHLNGELDIKHVETLVDHILPQVLNFETVKDYLSQHAFAETFTRRLLLEARSLGKLGPSQFSYIKLLDRVLWYSLNDEGLAGSSVEATGIKTHYLWELKTKRAHIFPMVEQAFSYLSALNLPYTCDDYDEIKIPLEHPYSSVYPYNPEIEYQEHLNRLKTDPQYRLEQTQIRQVL